MTRLMNSFPPTQESQVTLANWRHSPFNQWGFQHVREIIPTADIPADPYNLWEFSACPSSILTDFSISDLQGGMINLQQFFDGTHTDAFILIHQGRVLIEYYANSMRNDKPHILMSVSKSMLGLLVGILEADKQLSIECEAAHYVPELKGSGFEDVTIRNLLDMRCGLAFDEDYQATSGAIIQYRKATNWNPLEMGEAPSDLRSFLPTLKERSGPHGRDMNYISPCTDLLGWIIERATGSRFVDLFGELLWRPLGAAHHAYITIDRLGAPRCAGGICMTAMDLARVGQLIVEDGCRNQNTILPEPWLNDIVSSGAPEAWNASTFSQYWPGREMHYRTKWYVERGAEPLLSGFGIHGQHLFVDRKNTVVVAKLSSGPLPIDPDQIELTSRAVDAVRNYLKD